MARMFAKQHLDIGVSRVNGTAGIVQRLGSATLKVNNEVVDNTALLDDWKAKGIGPGEWSLDVEQAADSTMAAGEDLVALAAAKTSIAVILKITTGAGTFLYMSGTVGVESAENVIEGAIRQRATLVGLGALTTAP